MMMRLLALLLVATLLVSNVDASVPSIARTRTPDRMMHFEYWVRGSTRRRQKALARETKRFAIVNVVLYAVSTQ